MSKFNASIVAAVAALFVSGGAMAATLQPAAGNLPFVNTPVASSTVTRSAVEAQAATHMPAAGQHSAWALQDPAQSTLTRSAVEAQAATDEPAAGNQNTAVARTSAAAPLTGWHFSAASSTAPRMPAAGEFSSRAQPVSMHSTLTRSEVESQAAAQEPAAGNL
jgi:hypothetical protein